MSERAWLLRQAIVRIVADAPLPPATWTSVVRRALVIAGFFMVGLLVGDVPAGVLAAFGALQVGLIEAVLPFRRLLRLLVIVTAACTLSVAAALLVGGTWAAVVLVAVLAYLYGATASMSPTAGAAGISVLALAVIFAGMVTPRDQVASTVGWVLLGMVVQAGAWLLTWRPERRWFAQRAIANKLRADVMLVRHPSPDIPELVRTHTQSDICGLALSTAEFPEAEERRLREALSATVRTTRALIAWMLLDQPGDGARMNAGRALDALARRLEPGRRSPADPVAVAGTGTGTVASRGVAQAFDDLDDAVARVQRRLPPAMEPLAIPAAPPAQTPQRPSVLAALRPGTPTGWHGVRMAVGVGIAEALSIAVPVTHSFWLPLTVVFTLKADWAFTVIRGLNRTIGNLGAVIVLPALLLAFGSSSSMRVLPLLALAAITFRWFFGNYVVASFGLAGTILLLDETLNDDPSLFATRILAAALGAVLSLVVAWVIPNWSSSAGAQQADALRDVLARWRDDVRARASGGDVSDAALDRDVADARQVMLALDATASGALLEPRSGDLAVRLSMLLSAGMRELAALMSATYFLMVLGSVPDRQTWQDVAGRARLREAAADTDAALQAVPQRPADGANGP